MGTAQRCAHRSSLSEPLEQAPISAALSRLISRTAAGNQRRVRQNLEFRFLGNCPPTPPLSQHFALNRSKC